MAIYQATTGYDPWTTVSGRIEIPPIIEGRIVAFLNYAWNFNTAFQLPGWTPKYVNSSGILTSGLSPIDPGVTTANWLSEKYAAGPLPVTVADDLTIYSTGTNGGIGDAYGFTITGVSGVVTITSYGSPSTSGLGTIFTATPPYGPAI